MVSFFERDATAQYARGELGVAIGDDAKLGCPHTGNRVTIHDGTILTLTHLRQYRPYAVERPGTVDIH